MRMPHPLTNLTSLDQADMLAFRLTSSGFVRHVTDKSSTVSRIASVTTVAADDKPKTYAKLNRIYIVDVAGNSYCLHLDEELCEGDDNHGWKQSPDVPVPTGWYLERITSGTRVYHSSPTPETVELFAI